MRDAAQPRNKFRFQVEFEQAEHLRVTILLHNVDALMLLDEFVHFARERIGPQPQVIGFDLVFIPQLIAAFGDSPMRGSITDNADLRVIAFGDFRPGNERARRLKFPV